MALVSYHERNKLDDEFVVYRPPVSSGKLEGTYYNPTDVWKPSMSYKYKLEDIKNQFTPAEYFRHTLATSGKYIRLIQKLERRWQKNHENWIRSAIRIQALHRGNVGRAYFAIVKIDLTEKRKRRIALSDAMSNFESGNFLECIAACQRYEFTLELLLIKLKALYQLGEYRECIITADEIIVENAMIEDSYYIKSCAFIKLNKDYEAAYDTLKMMMIQLEEPRDDSFRLFGYIAVKLQPKLFMESVDSFDVLIRRNPKDYDAEWDLVLKDLNYILAFNPGCVPVRMIRARTYSCMRRWQESKQDYMYIVYNCHPKYHPDAQKGLDDITHVTTVLPMIDADILNNV